MSASSQKRRESGRLDVSDVLRDRMSEPAGLQRMAAVSAVAHGAVLAAILFAPAGWLGGRREAPRVVMTISLGSGTPGPKNGGMTSIGGRAIQEQAPPDSPKAREEVRPPAAKAPEMTAPKPGPPLKNANAAPVKQAPDQARGRTPTRGAEPTPGSALVETGARGQGFGLSTGGGTGTGSSLDIDVANFCCPEYLIQMVDQIRGNWNDKSDMAGEVVVKFTIQRDGHLVGVEVEKPSGYVPNNLAAQRAVELTRQLIRLASRADFPNPTSYGSPGFQVLNMTKTLFATATRSGATLLVGGLASGRFRWCARQRAGAVAVAAPPQQPNEVTTTISSDDRGAQPRFAVPDFIALSTDKETVDAAKVIARVLWDDLNFEHEFALIPRDVYATIPAAASIDDVAVDRWRELNADGVVVGTGIQKIDIGRPQSAGAGVQRP